MERTGRPNKTMLFSMIFLGLAITAYSCGQCVQHGKFKWGQRNPFGFWGSMSDGRKYKYADALFGGYSKVLAPNTFYYRFFKIRYKEAYPFSATFLVAFTDIYHLSQSISFICLAFAVTGPSLMFVPVWLGILVINAGTYKILSK
jgi:hypothetical protein